MVDLEHSKIGPWSGPSPEAVRKTTVLPGLPGPRRWRGVLREPLLHFAIAGGLLFAGGQAWRHFADPHRIVVGPAEVAQVSDTYRQQYGADPSPSTLQALIDRRIDDEVLYREGLALKLDQGDEIVRRRIVQKMQFLQQDLKPTAAPTEAALHAYYQGHRARYAAPEQVGFSHIFFSSDKGGAAAARARAEAALGGLSADVTRAPDRGDVFSDSYDFTAFDREQALRLFGHTSLVDQLFKAPQGRWSGPYRSGFGWHLVRISGHEAAHVRPFDEVRDQVAQDVQAEGRDRQNNEAFQALKRRYQIVRPDHG